MDRKRQQIQKALRLQQQNFSLNIFDLSLNDDEHQKQACSQEYKYKDKFTDINNNQCQISSKIPTSLLELAKPNNFPLLLSITKKLQKLFLNQKGQNTQKQHKTKNTHIFTSNRVSQYSIQPYVQEQRRLQLAINQNNQSWQTKIIIVAKQNKKKMKNNENNVKIAIFPSYLITYQVRIYWEQLITSGFDINQLQPHELRQGQYFSQSINITRKATQTNLCDIIIEKSMNNHPSIKTISILSYQLDKKQFDDVHGKFAVSDLKFTVNISIRKLFFRPKIKYSFDVTKLGIIENIKIHNSKFQMIWRKPISLRQVDFYNDISFNNCIPQLSHYLLQTVQIIMKTNDFTLQQFKTIMLRASKKKNKEIT